MIPLTTLFILLLLPFPLIASPITVSHEGHLITPATLGDGIWFEGSDFLLMVYHDTDTACCEPTLDNPTLGFHIESLLPDGRFRVDITAASLKGACGFLQIDAQERLPSGGLGTLVAKFYDTGTRCGPPPGHTVPDITFSMGGFLVSMGCLVALRMVWKPWM